MTEPNAEGYKISLEEQRKIAAEDALRSKYAAELGEEVSDAEANLFSMLDENIFSHAVGRDEVLRTATSHSEDHSETTEEDKARELIRKLNEAGISNEEIQAKIGELGSVEAAIGFFEDQLAATEEGNDSFDLRAKLRRYRELEDLVPSATGDTRIAMERELVALKSELQGYAISERQADRYSGQGIFVRIDNAKETAVKNVRAFSGLRINENEVLGQLNGLAEKIDGIMKEGDEGSAERREAVRRGSALQFELEQARKEVIEIIKRYDPVEALKLRALRELEISEDERVSVNNDKIRELLKIKDDPELNAQFGAKVDVFRDEYAALVRIHNFAVAGKGKGAVEITTALGELNQAALAELFGGKNMVIEEGGPDGPKVKFVETNRGELIRKEIVDAYILDEAKFAEIDAGLLGEAAAKRRLENETFLGNNKRTFIAGTRTNPETGAVEVDDALETQYRNATTDDEKRRLVSENADRLTEGYKIKKAWEKKYVDDVLDAEFFAADGRFVKMFAEQNGLSYTLGGDGVPIVTDEIKDRIKNANQYQSRKIELSQQLDNITGFLETTIAPRVIKPIRVRAEKDEWKYPDGVTVIFPAKYKDNPLIKNRYPQYTVRAGGKVNHRVQGDFEPIFEPGFYKYKDPSDKLFGDVLQIENSLEAFRDADILEKIRQNPEIINNLKDDVYKDAASAQANELFDKFEKFQMGPTVESAKAVMDAYFAKNPDDRREFNMRIIEAFLRYKKNHNGIYNFTDHNDRKNWGARRIEDYIHKAREDGLIGQAEEAEMIKRIFGGRLIKNGRLRLGLISKPAEFGGAWLKEVVGPKNLLGSLGFAIKTLFNQSKDQIKHDL